MRSNSEVKNLSDPQIFGFQEIHTSSTSFLRGIQDDLILQLILHLVNPLTTNENYIYFFFVPRCTAPFCRTGVLGKLFSRTDTPRI